jgi:hypothetical protein
VIVFSLKIAQAISAEAFDPPIFASLCSPNMNIALQRLSQFKRLIHLSAHSAIGLVKHRGNIVVIQYQYKQGSNQNPPPQILAVTSL